MQSTYSLRGELLPVDGEDTVSEGVGEEGGDGASELSSLFMRFSNEVFRVNAWCFIGCSSSFLVSFNKFLEAGLRTKRSSCDLVSLILTGGEAATIGSEQVSD